MSDRRPQSPFNRVDRPLLATIGVVVLAATLLPGMSEWNAEWRGYQKRFRTMVEAKYGSQVAKQIPSGAQQIWISALQRADRCTTCHQAVSWKGFENAPNPFRTHPREPLVNHPIEKFGCTVCHGGQGHAVDLAGAHGDNEYWDEPLLDKRLSAAYALAGVNRNALIQINCNGCHRYDKETKGADAINLAKRTFNEQPCGECHLLNGRGGTIGPDLTYVGDKQAEEFDFSRVRSEKKTAYSWHVAHLRDPAAIVPKSEMLNLQLTDEQAQALAMLIVSWRKQNIPAEYRPEFVRVTGHGGR